MTLHIRTARVSYAGPDRIDITRKSAGPEGEPFAPSWTLLAPMLRARHKNADIDGVTWGSYVAAYTDAMRASYRHHRSAWDALLARERVVLVCYCTDAERCHRRVLAGILAKLGAVDEGEIRTEPAQEALPL